MDWLLSRFKEAPDNVAFIHEGRYVKYGAVVAQVEVFRKRLDEQGVRAGDSVVVVGDFSPELYSLFLALVMTKAIVVPLTPHSVIEAEEALAVSGCDWQILLSIGEEHFQCESRHMTSANPLLHEFRASGRAGLILFSSGSTGKPKGILHDFCRVADKFRKQRQAIVAIPFLMVDHFGGINTLLAITASLGTVVTTSDRSAAGICRAIEKYKVQLLPTTPSFLTLLTASHVYRSFDLSSLRRITYGTEVMPQATLDRLRTAFPGVELLQTYGLSEVGVLHSQSRHDGSLWFRIGGSGFRTKIVDDVLWIKSDYAMVGYLNAPSEFDADGWFNTKDQVEVDGDYIRILGRTTDIINVGGQKVYPSEVENILLELSNVQDIAVFGERHPLLGQIVVAKVLLDKPEPLAVVKKRIRQVALEKLTAFKAPVKVILADGPLHSGRHKKFVKFKKVDMDQTTGICEHGTATSGSTSTAVQVCSRCIYDANIPKIVFDQHGVCNYCHMIDDLKKQYDTGTKAGHDRLAKIYDVIKREGRGKKYDCVVGVSGGTDSSYVLVHAIEAGLRPLAVHYDNTWNTAIATQNIRKLLGHLGVDLYTHVVDNKESDDIFRSFFLANVSEIDGPTDIALAETLYRAAAQYGVKYILEGHSFVTEGVSPLATGYVDGGYIASIHKKFGQLPMRSFPNMSFSAFLKWILFYRIKKIRPLWYISYNKEAAQKLLQERYSWEYYGGHHLENRMTAFNHSIYSPQKFQSDQRNNSLSASARAGFMTREAALHIYSQPPKAEPELVSYFKKRLRFSDEQYEKIMAGPRKTYRDYKTYKQRFERLRPLFYILEG